MKRTRAAIVGVLAILASTAVGAQETEASNDSTIDLGSLLYRDDRGGLTISSGKTYNRVEGLPVFIGPTYRNRIGRADLSLAALGIIRSSNKFHWDPDNLGHRLTADVRFGRHRGFALGASTFDEVAKIEPWQLGEPDGGLAAFFLRRDYFDWYGRHGGVIYASAFRSDYASVTLGYSAERWSSRSARDVFSVFRSDETWRPNPRVNDGVAHVVRLNFNFDTRNQVLRPWAGWYLNAEYERGAGNFETAGTAIGVDDVATDVRRLSYGRAFVDVRRYNRISPRRQLNGRLVFGGWLHGDPLPLERRLSVGGIGTLPGFDFRRIGIGTDVGQCARDGQQFPGRPAQCERIALAQLEYRHELVSELFDIFNRNGIRVRGAPFRVKPSAVAFMDAGRGWRVGSREGDLTYTSASLPGFDTWRTDVGLGLDLGIAGLYVAKAVSEAKEPANFFVRFRGRF
jgi:outer membrane protein assembly factor BamA